MSIRQTVGSPTQNIHNCGNSSKVMKLYYLLCLAILLFPHSRVHEIYFRNYGQSYTRTLFRIYILWFPSLVISCNISNNLLWLFNVQVWKVTCIFIFHMVTFVIWHKMIVQKNVYWPIFDGFICQTDKFVCSVCIALLEL